MTCQCYAGTGELLHSSEPEYREVAIVPEHLRCSERGEEPLRAPPETSRWLLWALLFVCRIGFGLEFQTVGWAASQLVSNFGFTHAQIGTLVGMFIVPRVVTALPSGYADRLLCDRVLVSLGLLAARAGGITASATGGFDALAAARMLCGVGFVPGTLDLTKMVADWLAC